LLKCVDSYKCNRQHAKLSKFSLRHKPMVLRDMCLHFTTLKKIKNLGSPAKSKWLHVDLTDIDRQMTITLNINNYLIKHFEELFYPFASLGIKDIRIKNKATYDRGDANIVLWFKIKHRLRRDHGFAKTIGCHLIWEYMRFFDRMIHTLIFYIATFVIVWKWNNKVFDI